MWKKNQILSHNVYWNQLLEVNFESKQASHAWMKTIITPLEILLFTPKEDGS